MCEESPAGQTANLSEDQKNLRNQMILAEYNSCRDMIKKNIEVMERNMVLSITAVAAVAAFCLNKIMGISPKPYQHTMLELLSLIPLAIAILGTLRFISIDRAIGIYNDYIQCEVERNVEGMHFTGYFRSRNREMAIRRWHWIFWLTLLFFTCLFAGIIFS